MSEKDNKPVKKRVPAAPKKFHLRLRLVDYHGNPLPEKTKCYLKWSKIGDADLEMLFLDSNGVLDCTVPLTKHTATAWLLNVEYFDLGYIGLTIVREAKEPGDSLPGARMRLNNLGYLSLTANTILKAPLDDFTQRGIERFQTANRILEKTNLPPNNILGAPTGKLDAETKQRLEEAHDTDTGALLK